MNFNPQERMGLQSLLAALQGGLDPNAGYSVLGDILAQQAARVDQRKAIMMQQQEQALAQQMAEQEARLSRRQGLVDLVTQSATQGYPVDQVQQLVDLATPGGGMPPVAKQAIATAFPTYEDYSYQQGGLYQRQDEFSPLYTQSPDYQAAQQQQAVLEAQTAQDMETEAAAAQVESDYATFTLYAIQAKQQGISPMDFIQQIGAVSPMLLSADPSRVKSIMDSVFGSNWNLQIPTVG